MSVESLKKTPFHALHIASGANMVDFGGWHMPVRYSGDKKEHNAVREKAGLFDVSHMGEITIKGPNSLKLLQYITCNDVSKLVDYQIHYNVLMTPQGGFVDDILIYRFNKEHYFVVVNASNQDKDHAWIVDKNKNFSADVIYDSPNYAQLALQGPNALKILNPLVNSDISTLNYYHFLTSKIGDVEVIVSRTGYTASDGYEIYFNPVHADTIWNKLVKNGAKHELALCGLGSRDSLRLEGCMILYGMEANETTTVLEAGLKWITKIDKGDFIGKNILEKQLKDGLTKKLVALEMTEFGIPRHGYKVLKKGTQIGEITSGGLSITLNKPIAMAYVAVEHAKIGTELSIQIRKKTLKAKIVKSPFYRVKRT